MKYPKVLQVLALATAITVAVPGVITSAQVSQEKETPKEYEERTGYVLQSGYHYKLQDDLYVILDEKGLPVLEKDAAVPEVPPVSETVPVAPAVPETVPEMPGEIVVNPEETTGVPDEAPVPPGAEAEVPGETPENPGDASGIPGEMPENPGTEAEIPGETPENPGDASGIPGETPGNPGDGSGIPVETPGNPGDATGVPGETPENPGDFEGDGSEQDENGGQEGDGSEQDGNGSQDGDGSEQNGNGSQDGDSGDQDENGDSQGGGSDSENSQKPTGGNSTLNGAGIQGITGNLQNFLWWNVDPNGENVAWQPSFDSVQSGVTNIAAEEKIVLPPPEALQVDDFFLTSDKFKEVRDRIQYNVTVPIEGIPSFITQEMIVGALKAQDETGYPASVTIAQIIQESGYGIYGPGGEDGKGLSYLAYQYCNLFGIKGKGTAGSANMNTFEMTADGAVYSISAAFRAYHTYTECIEDRSELLEEVYSDLTENVTDANTFAMRIGRRWATDLNYGRSLIRTMEKYDLYRLDELTLLDFNAMIGRFANPCPGSSITSTFGYRTFDHSYHKGLDMGTGAENIPTYAAEAGTVIFAGNGGTAGNLIVIDHGDGLITKYMHHEEIYVEQGQEVAKGQQIGLSGTTGNSTGNHLHFQVEENGTAVNPLRYLQDGGNGQIVKLREKEEKMTPRERHQLRVAMQEAEQAETDVSDVSEENGEAEEAEM